MILRARGDLLGALEAVRQVTDALVSGVFSFVREATSRPRRSRWLLDDLVQAEERLDYLEGLPPVQMTPFVRAQASRLRARLLAARGEVAGVEAGFKSSVGLFRELTMPYWLAVALAEQGEWLDRTGPDRGRLTPPGRGTRDLRSTGSAPMARAGRAHRASARPGRIAEEAIV